MDEQSSHGEAPRFPSGFRPTPAQPQPQQHQGGTPSFLDQRRHTVDCSAWSSFGLTFDPVSVSLDESTEEAAPFLGGASGGSKNALPWSNESLKYRGSTGESQQQQRSFRGGSGGEEQPSSTAFSGTTSGLSLTSGQPGEGGMSRLHPNSNQGGPLSDQFGRRASMSQLSFYGGVWDQPDPGSLHKHSHSFQQGSLYDHFSFPAQSNSSQKSTGDISKTNNNNERESSFPSLPSLQEDQSYSSLDNLLQHQPPPPPPLSSLASSRRNSRVLPNPIQPPAMAHARKVSMDDTNLQEQHQQQQQHHSDPSLMSQQPRPSHHKSEYPPHHPFSSASTTTSASTTFSDLASINNDDSSTLSMASSASSTIQHGGFVPGFDIWSRNERPRPQHLNNPLAMDAIASQRRKSESVLHDLVNTDLDYLALRSFYKSSTASSLASAASSTRSSSPPDGRHPHLLQQQQHSSSGTGLNRDLNSSGNLNEGTSGLASRGSMSSITEGRSPFDLDNGGTLPSMHPHFAASQPKDLSQPGSNVSTSNTFEMCGLCSVQLATVPLGSCGHRVCNVCHRHEKHRSLRLFQSPVPPCPFCTHGVGPGTPLNADQSKQQLPPHHRLSLPLQTSQHPGQYQQQQQHRYTNPYQGGRTPYEDDDSQEGYPQHRQYHQTFPTYGDPAGTALTRTSSMQMDGMSASSSFSGMSTGVQHQQQQQSAMHASHQKPPPGFYPWQPKTLQPTPQQPQQGQFHPLHAPQHQHHPGSGLNQYAPNFQPGATPSAVVADRDLSGMGRPGMVSPPTGAWRDGGLNEGYPGGMSQDAQVYQQQLQRQKMGPTLGVAPGGSAGSHLYYGAMGPGSSMLSFSILPNLPPAVPPTTPRTEAIQWAVVRVTNIPWDVSLQDMIAFFAGFPIPPEHLLAQNVHILMDRATGKTFNSAFVELALTPHQAGTVAQARNLKVLKGRLVTVELSSQDELMRSVFPKWAGQFLKGEPVIPGEVPWTAPLAVAASASLGTDETKAADSNAQQQQTMGLGAESMNCSTTSLPLRPPSEGPSASSSANSIVAAAAQAPVPAYTPPFVTRDEINALLVVCRNYKLHFSRKCAERPFENILSILAKYPWHQSYRVLPLHRDHIFELLKLSIESLRMHLGKEYNTIHPTLLNRMVRCAILTPAFTERQKAMVLHVAGCPCPEDIVGWMVPVVPAEAGSTVDEPIIEQADVIAVEEGVDADANAAEVDLGQATEAVEAESEESAAKGILVEEVLPSIDIDDQIASLGIQSSRLSSPEKWQTVSPLADRSPEPMFSETCHDSNHAKEEGGLKQKEDDQQDVTPAPESVESKGSGESPSAGKSVPAPASWAAIVAPVSSSGSSSKESNTLSAPISTTERTPATSQSTCPSMTEQPGPLKSSVSRQLTLAPSYAAAVVQTASTGSCQSRPLSFTSYQYPSSNLAMDDSSKYATAVPQSPSTPTIPATPTSASTSQVPQSPTAALAQQRQRHPSGRSLSLSGVSAFSSPTVPRLPAAAFSFSFPALTKSQIISSSPNLGKKENLSVKTTTPATSSSTGSMIPMTATAASALQQPNNRLRSGSLPKLTPLVASFASAAASSSTVHKSSNLSKGVGTLSGSNSPLSTDEKSMGSLSSSMMTTAAVTMSSSSESILSAIKTITQSTPRLARSGAFSSSASSSSLFVSGTGSGGGSGGGVGGSMSNRQQRREGGETL